jgi:trigger factor
MLGEPLPSEKQERQDLENESTFTFVFDIAVAPEFKVSLTGRDKIDYYTITVDDKLIDQQVEMFTSRMGSYEKAESYEDNDILKGDLRELDENGNTKEEGITVEAASVMPSYIKVEEQKNLFNGAKVGDIITFNPKKAYPENDAEIASLLKIDREAAKEANADFSFQVTEISRFKKHAVDQELFDQTFGEGEVKDEKAFREKIAEGLKEQLQADQDFKFIQDVRAHCEKKVGKLEFPDALLKRIMLNSNQDKGEKFVEDNYENSIKELKWHLIKEQLVAAQNIKIDDADIKETAMEAARAQFAQYGMTNIPEEYLENYANEILKQKNSADALVDRSIDRKLSAVLKTVVKLNQKEVSVEDFNKMMSE